MSLASVLGLVSGSLNADERRGWPFAEQTYTARKSPTEPKALLAVLNEIVRESMKQHVRYSRFLYGQMKRLERGEWAPTVSVVVQVPVRERSEADKIAEARATQTPEQFERYLSLREQASQICGIPTAQPQKTVVEFKRRQSHG
jgi:hypothetical protein